MVNNRVAASAANKAAVSVASKGVASEDNREASAASEAKEDNKVAASVASKADLAANKVKVKALEDSKEASADKEDPVDRDLREDLEVLEALFPSFAT